MPAAIDRSRSSFRARRQGDDRQVSPGRPLPLPDRPHDLQAVESRHVDVQEQQVERLLARQVQCHAAVGHDPHQVPPPGQQPLDVPRVQLAVLGHEDPQRRPRGAGARPGGLVRGPGVEPIRGMGSPPEPRGEGEGTATAGFALHIDRPAHQADELSGDRQAQPGAAEFSRRGAVHLLEGPEDLLPGIGRDADAGVAHGESKDDLAPGRLGLWRRPRATATSPRLVNLIALPIRLNSTCRRRPASPTSSSGTLPGCRRPVPVPCPGPGRSGCAGVPQGRPE